MPLHDPHVPPATGPPPPESTSTPPRLPAPPSASELQHPQPHTPSPSNHGSYYHHQQLRPHSPYGHPRRPQSALVRGGRPPWLDSTMPAGLTNHSRRPSAAHSLPQPQMTRMATPLPSRLAYSEITSTAGRTAIRPAPLFQYPQPDTSPAHDLDIEQYLAASASHQSHSPRHVLSKYSLSDVDDEDEKQAPTARQTIRSLLHLALFATPLSFGIVIYSLFALVYAIFTSPLKLCFKARPSLSQQLMQLLLPPLNLQRRCIFLEPMFTSPSRSSSSSRTPLSSNEAVFDNASLGDVWPISAGNLLTTHLFAPLVAFPLAFGAWIMAAAWMLGAIVSDESAGDDRDERRLAERVVDWWAGWLNWGLAKGKSQGDPRQAQRGRHRARQEMSMKQDDT